MCKNKKKNSKKYIFLSLKFEEKLLRILREDFIHMRVKESFNFSI